MAKVQKSTDSSGLAEVVDRILDKVRVSPLSRQKIGLYLVNNQAVCFVCRFTSSLTKYHKGFLSTRDS